jgi:uncharacterized protein (DUF58 family)
MTARLSPQPAPFSLVEGGPLPRQRKLSRVRLTPFGLGLGIGTVVLLSNAKSAVDPQVVAAVVVVVLGIAVIGVVWPIVAVRRVHITQRSPRDATVGEVVPIWVEVTRCPGGCQLRSRDPTGTWHRALDGAAGHIDHLADTRGTFNLISIEIRVTAPLGVIAAHRIVELWFPTMVDVAPRPLTVTWDPATARLEGAESTLPVPVLTGEVVRSVRPYTTGDPAHLVHWPSTARTGALVVRDMEPPARTRLAIVVDLREVGTDTERVASFAHGLGLAVLAAGGEVLLATYDARADAPLSGAVRSRLDLGRRLARATLGPPGHAPAGWPVIDVRDWWWRHYGWHARADGPEAVVALDEAFLPSAETTGAEGPAE